MSIITADRYKYWDLAHQRFDVADITDWRGVAKRENHERLVDIGIFTKYYKLLAMNIYGGAGRNWPYSPRGLNGSLLTVFLRENVADLLLEMVERLPKGIHLLILDGYRPPPVQDHIHSTFKDALHLGHLFRSKDWLLENTATKVLPADDQAIHLTGSGVDFRPIWLNPYHQEMVDDIDAQLQEMDPTSNAVYLLQVNREKIIRENAQPMNMGCAFDEGGATSDVDHYEDLAKQRRLTPREQEAFYNIRFLANFLWEFDVSLEPSETFHMNMPWNQKGAIALSRKKGQPDSEAVASYGAAPFSKDNQRAESLRKLHHNNVLRMSEGERWDAAGLEEEMEVAIAGARLVSAAHAWQVPWKQVDAKVLRPESAKLGLW